MPGSLATLGPRNDDRWITLNRQITRLDFRHHLGPVLEHRHLVTVADVETELAIAGGLDRLQLLDQLRARSRR
jgi:hypothetical protein